ncbi:MAG: hypothetical protein A2X67_08640 [Ignavibacteria bacterium GWA2_55_11]|nr:MAG: hypothetical protein A2X67_08640 [Ignavibacteria bacterium GWA2_55_11]OGU44015.1 MAG: hypothetical protein A2X68_02445 [Ignavibacteria bacterium GWC2_56_12]OGU72704.1 MAG: hypothetical protein A3G43_05905 [Ignavibacteria bacterium RIFCSPLOWO2_12_FULL_56_21]
MDATNMNMTHDEARDWMLEDLRGTLPKSIRTSYDAHLLSCSLCRTELAELKEGWSVIERLPEIQPPPAMRTRFRAVLAAYEHGVRAGSAASWQDGIDRALRIVWPARPVWQAAVGLGLLLIGLLLGSLGGSSKDHALEMAQLRGEMQAMSRMLAVSLLQQQSASERLKGVSMSTRFDQSDDEITAALVDALKFDTNVNVRLAALDALTGEILKDEVRKELIGVLLSERSPLVQLAMVEILAESRDTSTDEALRRLMNAKEVNPVVKERVRTLLGSNS